MRWFTLGCVALVGCSGGEADDTGKQRRNRQDDTGNTGNTDDTSTYEPPPPWTPTTGNYVLTSQAKQTNTCGTIPGGETGTPSVVTFGVSVAGDASGFTLSGDDPFDTATATTTVNCPLVQTLEPEISYAFDCETAHSELPWEYYGFEGVFTLDVDVVGTWTTETHWTGLFTSVADCHGPDCDVAEDFLELTIPCTIVADGVVDIGS